MSHFKWLSEANLCQKISPLSESIFLSQSRKLASESTGTTFFKMLIVLLTSHKVADKEIFRNS